MAIGYRNNPSPFNQTIMGVAPQAEQQPPLESSVENKQPVSERRPIDRKAAAENLATVQAEIAKLEKAAVDDIQRENEIRAQLGLPKKQAEAVAISRIVDVGEKPAAAAEQMTVEPVQLEITKGTKALTPAEAAAFVQTQQKIFSMAETNKAATEQINAGVDPEIAQGVDALFATGAVRTEGTMNQKPGIKPLNLEGLEELPNQAKAVANIPSNVVETPGTTQPESVQTKKEVLPPLDVPGLVEEIAQKQTEDDIEAAFENIQQKPPTVAETAPQTASDRFKKLMDGYIAQSAQEAPAKAPQTAEDIAKIAESGQEAYRKAQEDQQKSKAA